MTSPLKQTREHKKAMLLDMLSSVGRLLSMPKGSLDRMDLRILKQISNKLKEMEERAKPV